MEVEETLDTNQLDLTDGKLNQGLLASLLPLLPWRLHGVDEQVYLSECVQRTSAGCLLTVTYKDVHHSIVYESDKQGTNKMTPIEGWLNKLYGQCNTMQP